MKSTSLLKKSIAYSNMASTPVKIALLVLAIIVLVSILIFNCAVFSKYTYTYLTKIDSTVMENLASVTLRFSSKSTRRSQSNEPTMKFNQWRNKSNTLVINDATQRGKTLVVDDPISKPKNCLKDHCKEYLTIPELSALKTCQRESARARRTADIKVHIKENNCSFIDKSSRKPVALVSTEGSGNTWLRGLLEKTTGICSGFIYCDYFMRREGFIGEMIKSGSVLVVKTHTATPQWYGVKYKRPKRDEPYYGSAVFIVRNPYHSLIAEWNRRATNEIIIKKHIPHNESHTNVVPKEYWDIPQWDRFLHTYMNMWKSRIINWVLKSSDEHPVHVVRYEDLKKDTPGELSKILTFLRIPHTVKDISSRLLEDFTTFKRRHVNDNFEHYSRSQKQYIKSVLLDTIKLTQSTDRSILDIMHIEEYLPES